MPYTPGLFGQQLLPRDVHDLIYRHGWMEPLNMVKMVATANAESNLYTKAVGQINPDGTQDFGLFQLNSSHWNRFANSEVDYINIAYDPEKAAGIARELWRDDQKAGGTGFGPWAAFQNGAYQKYLPLACTSLCNFAANRLIGVVIL